MEMKYIFVNFCQVIATVYASTTENPDPNDRHNITHRVYFEISQSGEELGNIIFGLYGGVVPKTVTNFRTIALMGIKHTFSYMKSRFYLIVPGVKIQGGDIVNDDGSGHTTIWKEIIDPENFIIKHNQAGIVSMVDVEGKNKTGSQFFITLRATPEYDGKNVAFGKITKGMDVVEKIAKVNIKADGTPINPVTVTRIGELPVVHTDDPLYSWVATDF